MIFLARLGLDTFRALMREMTAPGAGPSAYLERLVTVGVILLAVVLGAAPLAVRRSARLREALAPRARVGG